MTLSAAAGRRTRSQSTVRGRSKPRLPSIDEALRERHRARLDTKRVWIEDASRAEQ